MKNFAGLILLLFIITGCTATKKIPEISPDLTLKKLEISTNLRNITSTIVFEGRIFLFSSKGRIYRYEPEKNKTELLLNLRKALSEEVSFYNNFAFLKNADKSSILIYDLKNNKIFKIPGLKNPKKIIGMDSDIIVYQNPEGLLIYNYKLGEVLKEVKYRKQKIFNCQFEKNTIFILGRKILYVFDILKSRLDEIKLNLNSSSPFVKSGDYIYFGSENRELVKFSINKKKISWKHLLPMKLLLKPIVKNKFIVVTPKDNNIYFFTKRGGLFWWKKFDSILASSPVEMEDNIAILMRSEDRGILKFYDPKEKKEKIYTKEDIVFSGSPLYYNGYIYLFSTGSENKEINFIKVGNKFGANIILSPREEFSTGRSIKFFINPVNIEKPVISAIIKSKEDVVIFKKHFDIKESPFFAWIPDKEGDYILSVKIKGKNGFSGNEEIEFRVADFEKIYLDFFYLIQKNCSNSEQEEQEKSENDR